MSIAPPAASTGSREQRAAEPTSSPLAGIRVLDLSRVVSGPLCGRMLADLGADVIKLEAPSGDLTRSVGPEVDGTTVYFTQVNAGKRNLCLDLKHPDAVEAVRKVLRHCDVLLENFRPGVLARLGLDPSDLLAGDPRLVICSITGYGQQGPWADRQAYAPYVHAEVGMIEMAGRLRGDGGCTEAHQHADIYGGLFATSAVLAALFERQATGRGRHLDVSMARATVYANEWAAVELHPDRVPRKPFDTWTFPVLPLGDGTPVSLMGDPVDAFPGWVAAYADEDRCAALLRDERFATREDRLSNRDDLLAAMREVLAAYPDEASFRPVWAEHQMLATVCRPLRDLARTSWATDVGLVAELADGTRVPAAPWTAPGSVIGARGGSAGRGRDNESVLTALAGLSSDEVRRLAPPDSG